MNKLGSNKALSENHVVCEEISLFPECSPAKVEVVGVRETSHQVELWFPPKHALCLVNRREEMLHILTRTN